MHRVHTGGGAAGGNWGINCRGEDMKIKLTFAQYMSRTKNRLLKAIFQKMLEEAGPKKWIRQFREYI